MKMTPKEYEKLVEHRSPRSPVVKNTVNAFWSGGLICVVGQVLTTLFGDAGLAKRDAAMLTSVTLILIAAVLTGFGVYNKLAKLCGAGTLVPITGFSNSVVSPAVEFKSEGVVTGLAAKIFTIAGPVLVFGISASVIYGLLLTIIQIL